MFLALLLCVMSAVCYNGGVVLQSSGAYGSGDDRILRPSLFARLVRVRVWVVGTLLNVAGWAFQVWALTAASLTFVQPALGVGVVFLLGFAWLVLGSRPTVRDAGGAVALVVGIALLTHAAPAPHTDTARARTWFVAAVILAALALAPLVLRAARRVLDARVLAVSVGFAFALTGLTSEVTSRGLQNHRPAVLLVGLTATAVFGGIGFLTETSALVTGSVTAVVPIIVLIDTALPVSLAPFLFDERWPRTWPGIAGLAAGIVLSVGGAASLAASPRVTPVRNPDASQQRATPSTRTDS